MKKAVGTAIVKKSAEIDFRRAERAVKKNKNPRPEREKIHFGRAYGVLKIFRQALKHGLCD